MEGIVEKVKNSDDYDFISFNISLNPFNPIYEKSLLFKKAGDEKNAERFRNYYTGRMANTIFTMTPLLEKNNLAFISRAFNGDDRALSGYNSADLKSLIKEIIKKLEILYFDDLDGEQKVVKSSRKLFSYLYDIKRKANDIDSFLRKSGRLESKLNTIYRKEPPKLKIANLPSIFEDNNFRLKWLTRNNSDSIIDVNGEVYLCDDSSISANTNINLNYYGKYSDTPPIKPIY